MSSNFSTTLPAESNFTLASTVHHFQGRREGTSENVRLQKFSPPGRFDMSSSA